MMTSTRISILVFVWLLNLSSLCNTADSGNASSSDERLRRDDLDQTILYLLESNLLIDRFVDEAQAYARNKKLKYNILNLRALYHIYKAYINFEVPCDLDTLAILGSSPRRVGRIRNERLKNIAQYFLQEKPPGFYSENCIREYDSIARQTFSYYDEASELMFLLAQQISSVTRRRMNFAYIKADLDPKIQDNHGLRTIIQTKPFQYYSICNKLEENESIKRIISVFSKILGSMTALRTNEIIRILNEQIIDIETNTIKLLSLAMFCEAAPKPHQLTTDLGIAAQADNDQLTANQETSEQVSNQPSATQQPTD